MADLLDAAYQWATRPADQCFATLPDLWYATRMAYQNSKEHNVVARNISAVCDDGIRLCVPGCEKTLGFNNWSMGQFASQIGTSMRLLTGLTGPTIQKVLNEKLAKVNTKGNSQIYYDTNASIVRAFTTQNYGRVPNYEIVARLMEMTDWVNPPARPASKDDAAKARPATQEDVDKCGRVHNTLGIKVGDPIVDKGLYASDRDMFIFEVSPKHVINDGSDGGMYRGFFVRNSEVGNSLFELVTFLYRSLCGNHIVWGVEDVRRIKVKHSGRGTRDRIMDGLELELATYANASTEKEEAFIRKAQRKEIAGTKDGIVQLLFHDKKILDKKTVLGAYEEAVIHEKTDGNPRSYWGFTQGLTRFSQTINFGDKRNELDQVGGKILAMADAVL
jgi:hypothetical protein